VSPRSLRPGQVNFRSHNSWVSLGEPSPGRRRACVLFGASFRGGHHPTGLPGDTVWLAFPPTGRGRRGVLSHRRQVAENFHWRCVAAACGAAELVTLPQCASTRDPTAVRDLGLALAIPAVAPVLVMVGTDGVVHVQRAVARHVAADDILIRQVSSGQHGLNSEVVRL